MILVFYARQDDAVDALVFSIQKQDGTVGGALLQMFNKMRAWLPYKVCIFAFTSGKPGLYVIILQEVQASITTLQEGDIVPIRVVDCTPSQHRMTAALDADARQQQGDATSAPKRARPTAAAADLDPCTLFEIILCMY